MLPIYGEIEKSIVITTANSSWNSITVLERGSILFHVMSISIKAAPKSYILSIMSSLDRRTPIKAPLAPTEGDEGCSRADINVAPMALTK
jgi:hypothetical protein